MCKNIYILSRICNGFYKVQFSNISRDADILFVGVVCLIGFTFSYQMPTLGLSKDLKSGLVALNGTL